MINNLEIFLLNNIFFIVKTLNLMYNYMRRKEQMEEEKNIIKEILEWGYCIIIAVILALLVRYYIGTPTVVQQQSMETTLMPGDRLILSRLKKTTNKTYERGDIITFEAPSTSIISMANVDFQNPVAEYKNEPQGLFSRFVYYILEVNKTSYIKRIIGVAGDHIEIKDNIVYLNGKILKEDYIDDEVQTNLGTYGVFSDVVVPEGYVFVLGDNREHSTDSRCFGCVPVTKIEGKVWIRFWPLSKFGNV